MKIAHALNKSGRGSNARDFLDNISDEDTPCKRDQSVVKERSKEKFEDSPKVDMDILKNKTLQDTYFSKCLTSMSSKAVREPSPSGTLYHPYARYSTSSRGHDITPYVIPRLCMFPERFSPYAHSLFSPADSRHSFLSRSIEPHLFKHSSLK